MNVIRPPHPSHHESKHEKWSSGKHWKFAWKNAPHFFQHLSQAFNAPAQPHQPMFWTWGNFRVPQMSLELIAKQAGCNPHQLDSFGNNVMIPTSAYGCRDGLRAILALVPEINIAGALHFSVLGEGAPQVIIPELLMAGRAMFFSTFQWPSGFVWK